MNAVLLGQLFLTLVTVEEFGDKKPSQLLRWMQQLLGDAAVTNPDNKFLCELFLQHLPSQIRMVLASAGEMSLEALAQLAEVATLFVSTLSFPPLWLKWNSYAWRWPACRTCLPRFNWPSCVSALPASTRAPVPVLGPATPSPPPHQMVSAGTTAGLESKLTNVPRLAPGRETPRPGADGDRHPRVACSL